MEDDKAEGANDPYQNMEKPDIGKGDMAKKVLGGVEQVASIAAAVGTGGASAGATAANGTAGAAKGGAAAASGAETGATAAAGTSSIKPKKMTAAANDGFKSGIADAQKNETNPRGVHSGNKDSDTDDNKSGLKKLGIPKMLLPLLVIFG